MRKHVLLLSLLVCSLLIAGCEREKQQVTATLKDHTGCKNLKSASDSDVPNTQSCINWAYDNSTGVLSVKHINAGFNCCPDKLSCDVSLVGDTLVINEKEKSALCDCDCLFDLFIEVNHLEPQGYFIRIGEPYCGDQQKLIFRVDLVNEPTGTFCAARNWYPWGMP